MRTKKQNKIYCATYRRTHRKAYTEKMSKYYQAHKEHLKILNAKYYQVHKEQIKISNSKYLQGHKEQRKNYMKVYNAEYRQVHKEKRRFQYRKYKALKYGVYHEDYTNSYIFLRDNWVCGICGRKINKRLKYPNPLSSSIDHIIPLSRDGNDNPINVQAAHLRCNVGKNAMNKGQLRLFG